jgi:hypothetical protein
MKFLGIKIMFFKLNAITVYPSLFLVGIIGFALGGSMSSTSTTNEVLKMCNQKPLECKFKYDILMYNETGKVPYTATTVTPKPTEKK